MIRNRPRVRGRHQQVWYHFPNAVPPISGLIAIAPGTVAKIDKAESAWSLSVAGDQVASFEDRAAAMRAHRAVATALRDATASTPILKRAFKVMAYVVGAILVLGLLRPFPSTAPSAAPMASYVTPQAQSQISQPQKSPLSSFGLHPDQAGQLR